jgi:hypothetical protein
MDLEQALQALDSKVPVPLHQKIAAANHATIAGAGADAAEAILQDIRDDRDRAYADITAARS